MIARKRGTRHQGPGIRMRREMELEFMTPLII
jgi:hypothetical protein